MEPDFQICQDCTINFVNRIQLCVEIHFASIVRQLESYGKGVWPLQYQFGFTNLLERLPQGESMRQPLKKNPYPISN